MGYEGRLREDILGGRERLHTDTVVVEEEETVKDLVRLVHFLEGSR